MYFGVSADSDIDLTWGENPPKLSAQQFYYQLASSYEGLFIWYLVYCTGALFEQLRDSRFNKFTKFTLDPVTVSRISLTSEQVTKLFSTHYSAFFDSFSDKSKATLITSIVFVILNALLMYRHRLKNNQGKIKARGNGFEKNFLFFQSTAPVELNEIGSFNTFTAEKLFHVKDLQSEVEPYVGFVDPREAIYFYMNHFTKLAAEDFEEPETHFAPVIYYDAGEFKSVRHDPGFPVFPKKFTLTREAATNIVPLHLDLFNPNLPKRIPTKIKFINFNQTIGELDRMGGTLFGDRYGRKDLSLADRLSLTNAYLRHEDDIFEHPEYLLLIDEDQMDYAKGEIQAAFRKALLSLPIDKLKKQVPITDIPRVHNKNPNPVIFKLNTEAFRKHYPLRQDVPAVLGQPDPIKLATRADPFYAERKHEIARLDLPPRLVRAAEPVVEIQEQR